LFWNTVTTFVVSGFFVNLMFGVSCSTFYLSLKKGLGSFAVAAADSGGGV